MLGKRSVTWDGESVPRVAFDKGCAKYVMGELKANSMETIWRILVALFTTISEERCLKIRTQIEICKNCTE